MNLEKLQFPVYGVGYFRTGTTSIAVMLKDYGAVHEPSPGAFNSIAAEYVSNRIGLYDARDKLANLIPKANAVISAATLAPVIPALKMLNYEAKFILTVREPMSWLKSQIDYHANMSSPLWAYWRSVDWWEKHTGYLDKELYLRDSGLCSLSAYLRAYSRHVTSVMSETRRDQLLTIRTDKLSQSTSQIADFLNVPESSLYVCHCNKRKRVYGSAVSILDILDLNFVKEEIEKYCGWMYDNFDFPLLT